MKHIVYLDANANELDLLLSGKKSKVLRGAMSKKLPYGKVNIGDTLYFKDSKNLSSVKASGSVIDVIDSDALSKEESFQLIDKFRFDLMLSVGQMKQFAGKRYLTIIQVTNIQKAYDQDVVLPNSEPINGWVVLSNEGADLILAR